ncbi:hypothetical protein XELAEV_18001472mg [Xenopus laevis]|nr:hypothetical protein XELAEV_18001472mg [Xenopus laevis]
MSKPYQREPLEEASILETLSQQMAALMQAVQDLQVTQQCIPQLFLRSDTELGANVNSALAYQEQEYEAELDALSGPTGVQNEGAAGSQWFILKEIVVLSSRSFPSGRHYWEVEGSKFGKWDIGVAYPSIEREGDESGIGNNIHSWSLSKYCDEFTMLHNSVKTPVSPTCEKFRISLDYEAGLLSFYELSEPIRHLHTFTASFTEPLYPAFYVYDKGWVRICN